MRGIAEAKVNPPVGATPAIMARYEKTFAPWRDVGGIQTKGRVWNRSFGGKSPAPVVATAAAAASPAFDLDSPASIVGQMQDYGASPRSFFSRESP
mmetsp:Transcript_17157/g.39739  ORF Transcript_17157/g.39739 Transcript_17157/m.39739 type:complete len:96 (-) Transcript_17157:200-487(-)